EQETIDSMAFFCKSKGDCGADINIMEKYSDGGLSIKWDGTSEGEEPEFDNGPLDDWRKYGVFTGIEELSDSMDFDTGYDPDPAKRKIMNVYGPALLAGYVGATIAAAVAASTASGMAAAPSWIGWAATNMWTGSFGFGAGATTSAGEAGVTAGTEAGANLGGSAASVAGIVVGVILVAVGLITGDYVMSTMGVALVAGCVFGPLGCLVGAVIGLVLSFVLGEAQVREKTVEVDCKPWVPPSGSSDCEKCSDDLFKECSEYRCKSLGASCEWIPDTEDGPACVDGSPNDIMPPIITSNENVLTSGYTLKNLPNSPGGGY
ncbi:MAG: hypothetical protein GY861_13540, partial [bacterium]|nr:hypothetical protein [bacterium]